MSNLLISRTTRSLLRHGRGTSGYAAAVALVCFSHLTMAQNSAAYGPDDRLGEINNITTGTVLQAAGLLKTGKVYSLAIETKPPGLGKEGARYLGELGVVAVGGEAGAEVGPSETEGESAPVHQLLFADYGIYILEDVKTQELASDHAYEFLFILAAPRLTGTVQATIHPVAIR